MTDCEAQGTNPRNAWNETREWKVRRRRRWRSDGYCTASVSSFTLTCMEFERHFLNKSKVTFIVKETWHKPSLEKEINFGSVSF